MRLDHKSAQGWPAHVGLRAQDHLLQGSSDAETEQGGRNYDQGRYHVPDAEVGTPVHGRAGAATLGFLGVAEEGARVFETARAGLPAAVTERLAKSLEMTQRDLLGTWP